MMRQSRSTYRVVAGVAAGLLAILLLNLLIPAGGIAAAQDQVTPTPIAEDQTQTPVPPVAFDIQSTVALAPDGDLKSDGVINPGDTVTYTITVANVGDTVSGSFEIVAQYDPAFVSGVAAISAGGLGGQGQIAWSVSELDAGQHVTVTYNATLLGGFPQGRTQVTGTVLARAGSVELARANLPSIDVLGPNLRFANPPSFELVTDLAQNGRFDPGDTVRFIISYSNTGGGASQDVSIVADYPDALTPQVVGNPDGAEDSGGTLTWLIGSVPADGIVRTIRFSVTLANEFPAGMTNYSIPIRLESGTATLDEQAAEVQIAGPNLVAAPSYQLVSDVAGDGLADPGDTIEVNIQYSNVGTEPLDNVVLTGKFDPAQFEITQADQNAVIDAEKGIVTWTLPSVDVGVSGNVVCQAKVRVLPQGIAALAVEISGASDETKLFSRQLPIATVASTPIGGATATPFSSEIRPAQGQGLLTSVSVAVLVGIFLCLSLLALVYVASRVLPSTAEEREALDTEVERTANRNLVRELVEGIVLTAILFSVMVLGLQNALDRNSINSIIAGIVGYVAGRVSSTK
jgi:hypothetical protein